MKFEDEVVERLSSLYRRNVKKSKKGINGMLYAVTRPVEEDIVEVDYQMMKTVFFEKKEYKRFLQSHELCQNHLQAVEYIDPDAYTRNLGRKLVARFEKDRPLLLGEDPWNPPPQDPRVKVYLWALGEGLISIFELKDQVNEWEIDSDLTWEDFCSISAAITFFWEFFDHSDNLVEMFDKVDDPNVLARIAGVETEFTWNTALRMYYRIPSAIESPDQLKLFEG